MVNTTPRLARYPIATYLLIANGFTWLCWIPSLSVAARRGYALPLLGSYRDLASQGLESTEHWAVAIVFSLAVYGPLLAALVTTACESGAAGLGAWWRQVFKVRVAPRWYLVALGLAAALALLPLALGLVVGMSRWTSSGSMTVGLMLVALVTQVLTSGLGEEPGWRGFLRPRLQARLGGQRHIWVLGLIWAVWHYPYTVYVTLSTVQGLTPLQMAVTVVTALAGQTASLVGLSYVYNWLLVETKSVWLSMVFHALSNALPFIALSFVTNAGSLALFQGLAPWALVLLLEGILGKQRFPDPPSMPAVGAE